MSYSNYEASGCEHDLESATNLALIACVVCYRKRGAKRKHPSSAFVMEMLTQPSRKRKRNWSVPEEVGVCQCHSLKHLRTFETRLSTPFTLKWSKWGAYLGRVFSVFIQRTITFSRLGWLSDWDDLSNTLLGVRYYTPSKTIGAHHPRGRKYSYSEAWLNMNTVAENGLPFTSE